MHNLVLRLTIFLTLLGISSSVLSETTVLTIESWRSRAADVWENKLLPVFEAEHPGIDVQFLANKLTKAGSYNEDLTGRFESGTAGDLITCEPFDRSLSHFNSGYLYPLQNKLDFNAFSTIAKSAWATDDLNNIFCVPMGSVIHGYLYNKEIFNELGLSVPNTQAELFSLMDNIQKDGRYVPLSTGVKDGWATVQLIFANFGASFWRGEEGRLGLIDGTARFTDQEFVDAFDYLYRLQPYMPNGFQSKGYKDNQRLFSDKRAALYPTGSWEIPHFQKDKTLLMGVFPPPRVSEKDNCYLLDHTDIAMGLNANSENKEEALIFLEWIGSAEFADLYVNAFPGFFSLSNHAVEIQNPLAREYLSMRESCESTISVAAQVLGRGEMPVNTQLAEVLPRVMSGSMSPEAAARAIQQNLDSWYKPAEQPVQKNSTAELSD